jgi:hypothetical protein
MENNRFFPPNTTGFMQSHFTIRDHFAGLAMQALISKSLDVEFIIGMSYVYADAMMKERAK